MSTAKWWVLDGRDSGYVLEERPSGDVVVMNTETSEEHVLHGYVWKHSPSFGLQIQGEGPPPYGPWVENPED
jgi:hypothetical protein